MGQAEQQPGLIEVLASLRGQLERFGVPLGQPEVPETGASAAAVAAQIRDYIAPRVACPGAPLLVVVGGPTGAGKSTLVNTLVGRCVSDPGVLRPTTRSPVLVHHPGDAAWFAGSHVLPDVPRTTEVPSEPGTLRLVSDRGFPQGLAILDAPDVDSVVTGNRELAARLFAAADLWMFVTSAVRYSDAVPWDHLRRAAARHATVAVVLDRMPSQESGLDIRRHLTRMLEDVGLRQAPTFLIPESSLDSDGLLPAAAAEPVRGWLRALAGHQASRETIVSRTLDGAVRRMCAQVTELATGLDRHAATIQQLRDDATAAYGAAVRDVENAVGDGSVLRGEVRARWQAFVGTGEILRSLEARIGQSGDRAAAVFERRGEPGGDLASSVREGMLAVILDAADHAAERVDRRWRGRPGGAGLLAGRNDLAASSGDLSSRASEEVRAWQHHLVGLAVPDARTRRPRHLTFGSRGLALLLTVVVLAPEEAGLLTQRILEAVFGGSAAVQELVRQARADLRERVRALVEVERDRYDTLAVGQLDGGLDCAGQDGAGQDGAGQYGAAGDRLRRAADGLRIAWHNRDSAEPSREEAR